MYTLHCTVYNVHAKTSIICLVYASYRAARVPKAFRRTSCGVRCASQTISRPWANAIDSIALSARVLSHKISLVAYETLFQIVATKYYGALSCSCLSLIEERGVRLSTSRCRILGDFQLWRSLMLDLNEVHTDNCLGSMTHFKWEPHTRSHRWPLLWHDETSSNWYEERRYCELPCIFYAIKNSKKKFFGKNSVEPNLFVKWTLA